MKMILLLFEIILTFVCLQSEGADTKDLYVVVHVPFPDDIYSPKWDGGPSLVPGVQLAIEQINNRSDIIPGYNLKAIISDSGCDLYLKARVSQVTNVILGPDPVVGIIGPACSEAALATAPIQNKLKTIQITTATTPLLDDHGKYPFTFGIVSASTIYADAIFQLITENQWTSVGILYEIDRPYFASTYTRFVRRLPHELIASACGITSSYIPLEEVLDARTRVIIVLASTKLARLVMCLAHHKKILFPNFQFLFVDRLLTQFEALTTVSHRGKTYECSEDEMMTAINGMILNHYDLAPNEPDTTLVSQSTFADFQVQYDKKREEYGQEIKANISSSVWANPFYDATWALALSLNTCISEIASNNFSDLLCIRNEMYNVNFNGATGNVSFDNVTGHASTVICVHQINGGNSSLVGYYSDNKMTLNGNGLFIESSFEVEIVSVPLPYRVAALLVAVVGLVLTIFFHIINVWKRNHKWIKATSPNLNNFAFVGCYLVIASMVIIQMEFNNGDTSSALCSALIWCNTISYTLIFGTLCVKCWRLHRIFHHTFKKDKILSDGVLMLFVMFLVTIDLTLCAVYTVVSPKTLTELRGDIDANGKETIAQVCKPNFDWFFITETIYKASLTISIVCLSIHNRHIEKKNFRHTKTINVLIYSLAILLVLGVPLYALISQMPSLYVLAYVLACIILSGMLFLDIFFLFLPPSIPLLIEWKQFILQKHFKSCTDTHFSV